MVGRRVRPVRIDSPTQLSSSRGELSVVGVDGVNLTRDGAAVTPVSADALQLLREAHAQRLEADLLVGNFDDRLGDFSPAIGDALLGSPARIRAVASSLAREVRRHGWNGITIDFESLSDEHPAGLTRLVTELQHRLGAHHDVSICLMATTGEYAELGYDLRALGRAADHVVLMAYDQHGPTWSGPGPVGGTPWIERTLRPLEQSMARRKIELGVAGYGSTWPRRGTGHQVSDADARRLAEQAAQKPIWDARQQEWHVTTRSGTTLWWSDGSTITARIALARTRHLGGVAVALLSITYVSMTTVPFSEEDLALLLALSRMHNRARDLTGLLLHRNGQFMQALEGPAPAVRATLKTIAADPRHSGVWTLDESPITQRRFGTWSMGYQALDDEAAAAAPAWFGSEGPSLSDESRTSELLAWFRTR